MTTQQLRDNRLRIGREIIAAREARGMTQHQLAESVGMVQPNIARIESGKYSVGIDILSQIAEALGCEFSLQKQA